MEAALETYIEELRHRGLDPERERAIRAEAGHPGGHEPTGRPAGRQSPGIYGSSDAYALQGMAASADPAVCVRSLDELLERDRQREKDGFPRKIRVGKLVKPGKGDQGKVVVVPTTAEEKLIHDDAPRPPGEGSPSGGAGEGEEGEVIGESPAEEEGEPGAGSGGAGKGEGGSHEIESSAYDLGRVLTEKFELPNLRDKGKKRSFARYTYDLTDRHRGFGQFLDKKATFKRILERNIHLGRVKPSEEVDPGGLLVAPDDKVYRILSREKEYDSQALVFFVRDYSGSMEGKATERVAGQHMLIYAWLTYQYSRQVETRFVLHDTEAKEVPDFYTYYNSRVAGGTKVASAYRLVNAIVERDNLARDYNVYVFHGTDGDDWDTGGDESIPELKRMLAYAARTGITVVTHTPGAKTEVEKYVRKSKLLDEQPGLLRMDVMDESADESRLITGIKSLIS